MTWIVSVIVAFIAATFVEKAVTAIIERGKWNDRVQVIVWLVVFAVSLVISSKV